MDVRTEETLEIPVPVLQFFLDTHSNCYLNFDDITPPICHPSLLKTQARRHYKAYLADLTLLSSACNSRPGDYRSGCLVE